jgi:hypothetical protein
MSNLPVPSSVLPPVVVQGSSVKNDPKQWAQASSPATYTMHEKQQYDHEKQQYEYPLETSNELWSLPPGWIVERQESDGRLYYHDVATGRMSWVHPMAKEPNDEGKEPEPRSLWGRLFGSSSATAHPVGGPTGGRRTSLLDTPMNATRRPDSHQCCAFFSLIVCLPMGLCALIHSFKVDQAWKEGRYGDSLNHSRQSYNYACWGTVFGISLLFIWWFSEHEFQFPDWDFDFGG